VRNRSLGGKSSDLSFILPELDLDDIQGKRKIICEGIADQSEVVEKAIKAEPLGSAFIASGCC
jgi:hypothetical protein